MLDREDVDTDQIIPKQFLKRLDRNGLGRFLFHDWAKQPGWSLPVNPILAAGTNFGCGSSREAAVWTLAAYGIRAVIAPSLGDIFHENCYKNGLLPVILPRDVVASLRAQLHAVPGATTTVDLEAQTVTAPDGAVHRFEVDPFRKQALLRGQDEIALTLSYESAIAAFEGRHATAMPWLERSAVS